MKLREILESDDLYTKYFQRSGSSLSCSSDDSERGTKDAPPKRPQKIIGPVPLAPDESWGDDSTDNLRDRMKEITIEALYLYDVIVYALAMVLRIEGIVASILVSMDYYQKGDIDYMVYTVMCLVIPIFITSFISVEL